MRDRRPRGDRQGRRDRRRGCGGQLGHRPRRGPDLGGGRRGYGQDGGDRAHLGPRPRSAGHTGQAGAAERARRGQLAQAGADRLRSATALGAVAVRQRQGRRRQCGQCGGRSRSGAVGRGRAAVLATGTGRDGQPSAAAGRRGTGGLGRNRNRCRTGRQGVLQPGVDRGLGHAGQGEAAGGVLVAGQRAAAPGRPGLGAGLVLTARSGLTARAVLSARAGRRLLRGGAGAEGDRRARAGRSVGGAALAVRAGGTVAGVLARASGVDRDGVGGAGAAVVLAPGVALRVVRAAEALPPVRGVVAGAVPLLGDGALDPGRGVRPLVGRDVRAVAGGGGVLGGVAVGGRLLDGGAPAPAPALLDDRRRVGAGLGGRVGRRTVGAAVAESPRPPSRAVPSAGVAAVPWPAPGPDGPGPVAGALPAAGSSARAVGSCGMPGRSGRTALSLSFGRSERPSAPARSAAAFAATGSSGSSTT